MPKTIRRRYNNGTHMHEIYRMLLGILCVWRITHLIQAEDGPWDLMAKTRRAVENGFFGKLMDCFYCLSLWIAAPMAWFLGSSLAEKALLWPALSAAAILLERVTAPETAYREDPPANLEFTNNGD